MHAVPPRDVVRAHEAVSRDSAAAPADARRNYYDLRTDCGEGRAECCDSVHDANGVARIDRLSLFR